MIPYYSPEEYEISYDIEMINPNLYITLDSSGGLWSAGVQPWQEIYPWTFNQAN